MHFDVLLCGVQLRRVGAVDEDSDTELLDSTLRFDAGVVRSSVHEHDRQAICEDTALLHGLLQIGQEFPEDVGGVAAREADVLQEAHLGGGGHALDRLCQALPDDSLVRCRGLPGVELLKVSLAGVLVHVDEGRSSFMQGQKHLREVRAAADLLSLHHHWQSVGSLHESRLAARLHDSSDNVELQRLELRRKLLQCTLNLPCSIE